MYDKPTILCPCPLPKRLLTSNHWIARNDSSNVNCILQPDNFLFSPRLKYREKTKGDVMIKKLMSENNCYCRCKFEKLPKPSYFKRPNSCVGFKEEILTGENVDDDLRRKSLACVCEQVDDNDEDSVGAKRRQVKSLPAEVGFKPTEQRKKYEEYRQMQEEKFREKLLEDKEREEFEKFNSEYSSHEKTNSTGTAGGDYSNIDTILSTQKYGTNTSESQFTHKKYATKSSGDNNHHNNFKGDIRSAPEFRREHYFETHNIGKIADITGNSSKDQHTTCVHQFQLDDRWIPEPLNKDPFGRSICKICDKVMEGSRLGLSSGLFLTESDGLSRSKIKNYAESYKSGFTPTTINLGRGKSKIEVVLKDKDIDMFGNYINRVKRPVYRNSLALRHQRLRII